jgi:hypothetical protein
MRLVGQTLAVATTIALALGIAPACVDNDQSIYIHSILAPSASRTNGICSYTSDATQPQLSQGEVDVYLRDTYFSEILVGNGMIARGDSLAPRTESNRAHIQGGVVRVTDANGKSYGEFTALGDGFVDPSSAGTPNFGPMGITTIDATTMGKIQNDVQPGQPVIAVVNIKIFGQTLGGVDLESSEFQFPVVVCKGCLIQFTGHDDPQVAGVDCNADATAAATGSTGGATSSASQPPCFAGQDEFVQCTDCKATNKACTAPGVAP